MKLKVFQAGKGDCLLLTNNAEDQHILVDGGMSKQYNLFVAPTIGELAQQGKKLDLVYVSHIDQDHIGGVLKLMDNIVEWIVHDYQIDDNPTHPVPKFLRPPEIAEIWHNSFHRQVGENAGVIGDLLATTAMILSATTDDELLEVSVEQQGLATSIREAIQLSFRIDDDQLGIPLNKTFDNKLAMVREDEAPPPPIEFGTLKLYVLGPFAEDLEELRKHWNKWLTKNKNEVAKLEREAQMEIERLGTRDISSILDQRTALAKQLGDRREVTPPNIASLTLLVEEGNSTLLLTGDAHADEILKGLRFHEKLNANNQIHVDVLKVQHHGSKNNINTEFVSTVTANDYLFCADGQHHNPHLDVLNLIIDSRLGEGDTVASNPQAEKPFKFWFNSSEDATTPKSKKHMACVQKLITKRANESNNCLTFEFMDKETPFFDMTI
jgi:beta-lactamase superfamily II metal-dependent hydrolase